MAPFGNYFVPAEVLRQVLYHTINSSEVTGRGVSAIRNIALVSHEWNRATLSLFSKVPQRKKREGGNRKIIRHKVTPVGQRALGGGPGGGGTGDASVQGTIERAIALLAVELPPPVFEDEVTLKGGPLQVGEVLVWRDLEQALRCVVLNRENRPFWAGIRAIFVSFVASSARGDLKAAHLVFTGLKEIFDLLRGEGVEPKLQWLRLALSVWQGLEDMDAPGMFPLCQMQGIPFLRFHSATGKSLSCYISKAVRDVICSRASRARKHTWEPTGLENPCRGDWRVQALRTKRKRDSKSECLCRFLYQKYNKMYNKAGV